jgi:hypothetical protein
MRAARVIAAGSVINDPMRGTRAKQSQVWATMVLTGERFAIDAMSDFTASKTGREAATTIMTKTNNGSV